MAPGGAGTVNDASRPAAMAAARIKSSFKKDFFEAFILDFFAKTTSPIVFVSKFTSSGGAARTVKTIPRREFPSYYFCQSQHIRDTIVYILVLGDKVNFRFAHCGDFHLGYDFDYLPARKAAARQADLRVAFFRSVRETLKWGAQVFLISGDLFDTPYPSDRDIEIVSKNLSHLSKKGVRCFAIPGNHDPMHPKSVWNRSEIASHIHLFHGNPAIELSQKNIADLNLTIAGIPWDPKDVFKPPLQEILTQKLHLNDRSILLLHGSEATLASEHPAFKEHTFQAEDLKRLPFGYVAIGHYHKPMDVARWSGGGACYSGSPEGLRFSEHNLGDRSMVLGEIDDRGSLVQVKRKSLNARTMRTLSYSSGDGTTADDWFRAIDDMRNPDTLLRVRVPKQQGYQQRRAEVLLSSLCSDFFYLDIVWESPS